jgi:hypothetical protein
MGLALALGSAAIVLEITAELSHRSAIYRHHIESMGSRISQLRKELTEAKRQNAAMNSAVLANAEINRVLSARDAVLLRWLPNSTINAHGLVAVSRKASSAVVEVGGLSVAPGRKILFWWMVDRGGFIKATALKPAPDGRGSFVIRMPTRAAELAGVMITLEAIESPRQAGGQGNPPGGLAEGSALKEMVVYSEKHGQRYPFFSC